MSSSMHYTFSIFLGLLTAFHAHATIKPSACGILLYPRSAQISEPDLPSKDMAAKIGRSRLRSIFPAGLIRPSEATLFGAEVPLTQFGPDVMFDKDAELRVEAQLQLPGIRHGYITFYQLRYEDMGGTSVARYSILYTPKAKSEDTAGLYEMTVIEHPSLQMDSSGRQFYAPYNSVSNAPAAASDAGPDLLPVLNVDKPEAARLAMYLASLAVPKSIFENGSTESRFFEPVLLPRVISQNCIDEATCMTKVSVVATFTHRESRAERGEGPAEYRKTFDFLVTTKNNGFTRISSVGVSGPQPREFDRDTLHALEALAGEI